MAASVLLEVRPAYAVWTGTRRDRDTAMTAPAGAAVTGLTELAVRARTDAGQVNAVPRRLARADVLCIDKTGTLTEPRLRLVGTEVVTGRPPPRRWPAKPSPARLTVPAARRILAAVAVPGSGD